MLENCNTALEKWGGVSEIIDRWLRERQELLVLYCRLSDLVDEPELSETGESLQSLCQIMVDYVSAGHFEIYGKLVEEGREFSSDSDLNEARQLLKQVDSTTEFVLDFNDKYQEIDDLDTLPPDLSKLGELLASRFEAEDRVIEILHTAHRDKLAS